MHCKKCNTNKPESEFYASNKTRCKECIKSSVSKHRAENLERVREYDRMRGSMPHRVAARKEYQKTHAFAESHSAAVKRWEAKHPERKRASVAVNNAIRDGRLKKQPCVACGEAAEAHHPDYSRPLDVVWLCNPHHREVHAMTA